MASHIDWRREISARAKAAGVTLPEATIEEIAEHLDEIHTAALRSGANGVGRKCEATGRDGRSVSSSSRYLHAPLRLRGTRAQRSHFSTRRGEPPLDRMAMVSRPVSGILWSRLA